MPPLHARDEGDDGEGDGCERARGDRNETRGISSEWVAWVRDRSGRDGGPADQWPIDDEQEQDRDEVRDVADDLERRRGGAVAEQAAEHAADRAVVGQDRLQVERDARCWRSGPPRRTRRSRRRPGRRTTKIRTDAGHREEAPEVDAHAGDEDRPAERRPRPRGRASPPSTDVDAGALERQDRDQEQDGLDALADDREERERDEGRRAALGQRRVDAVLELALEQRGPGGASRTASR